MSKLEIYLNAYEAKKIAQALTPCISNEESRYYLNGVCLDASAEGLFAIATDGQKLGKLKLQPVTEEGEPDLIEYSFSHNNACNSD